MHIDCKKFIFTINRQLLKITAKLGIDRRIIVIPGEKDNMYNYPPLEGFFGGGGGGGL